MRTKTSHTPPPYKVVKQLEQQTYETGAQYRCEIWADPEGDQPVALCTDESDAAYIVKCVNAHEDMLACLKNLVDRALIKNTEGDHFDEAIDAIAKAEGKQP